MHEIKNSTKTIKCLASIWICKWNADVKTQKRILSKRFYTARVTLLSVEHLRTPGDDPNRRIMTICHTARPAAVE